MPNKLGDRIVGVPGDPLHFDLQLAARFAVEKVVEPNDLMIRLHVEFKYVLEETLNRLPALVLQARILPR
jgi:hypothetical protein